MRAPFVTNVLPTGKQYTLGIKTSERDVALVKEVVRRLEKEGVENVEITKEETKALYKVLYGKYNYTTSDLDFIKFFEKQKNWTADERKKFFASVRDLIQSDGAKSATIAIVILSCTIMFVTMIVATLVSSISPFTRVSMLTATCA